MMTVLISSIVLPHVLNRPIFLDKKHYDTIELPDVFAFKTRLKRLNEVYIDLF